MDDREARHQRFHAERRAAIQREHDQRDRDRLRHEAYAAKKQQEEDAHWETVRKQIAETQEARKEEARQAVRSFIKHIW